MRLLFGLRAGCVLCFTPDASIHILMAYRRYRAVRLTNLIPLSVIHFLPAFRIPPSVTCTLLPPGQYSVRLVPSPKLTN